MSGAQHSSARASMVNPISPSPPSPPTPAIPGAGAAEIRHLTESFAGMRFTTVDPSPAVQLDPAQQRALDKAVEGANVFVTGVGGTGKTVVLRTIVERLKEKGKVVAITAPTGIAAEAIG